jgi:hypothetical protein
METKTRWYGYLAYFVGGAALMNAVPHLGHGVSGSLFQTPFATPPGVGLSPAMTNVLWGLFNLALAYLLLARVGRFELRRWGHMLPAAAGGAFMAIQLARALGPLHGGG